MWWIDHKQGLTPPPFVGFPGSTSSKESAWQHRRHKRRGFDPWVGKTPWRRAWQPTPVFLPGESHGQRSWWASWWSHRVRQDWAHTHSHFSSPWIHVLCNTALQLLPSPGRIRISSPWTWTSLASAKRRKQKWAFPSDPVAKTPSAQCRRLVFDPWSEN